MSSLRPMFGFEFLKGSVDRGSGIARHPGFTLYSAAIVYWAWAPGLSKSAATLLGLSRGGRTTWVGVHRIQM